MVGLSVLEVFCDASNAAVVAICQYNVYETSPWNSKLASTATLSPIHVFFISPNHTTAVPFQSSIVIFLEACAPLVVSRMCSFLILYLRVTPYIQSTIASSSRLPQSVFLVASLQHMVPPHRNAQHSAAFLPIAPTCSHSICDFRFHTTVI